jgi:hypothetical protein
MANRLVLLDDQDILIDARFLLEGESISPSMHIELPVHKVIVGEQIYKASEALPSANSSQAKTNSSLSLNFERGIKFSEVMQQKLASQSTLCLVLGKGNSLWLLLLVEQISN